MRRKACRPALTGLLFIATAVVNAQDILHLPLGDPARSERTVPVVLDAITDTRSGEPLTIDQTVARLADVNVLFFGENHTDADFHRAQYQIIRALHRAGRNVMIGLEMFPYTRQADLDRWTRGELSEDEFLEVADWYGSWGYRWEFYDEIFRYARDEDIRLYGVNAPRDVVRAVRTEGFEGLSEEDLERVPDKGVVSSEEHRQLFKASFEDDDPLHSNISDEMWEGMIRAQATWDAVMGWNAAQAVKASGDPNAIIVVLIGAGHVTYGLGSERQIRPVYDGGIASMVPVQIRDADGNAVRDVQASYADFVWGLPPALPPQYPSLGVSLAGSIGSHPNKIIQVSEDSIAQAAGFEVGDLLISIDGKTVEALGSLRKVMADYNWGDSAEVQLGRGEKTLKRTVVFRRPEA